MTPEQRREYIAEKILGWVGPVEYIEGYLNKGWFNEFGLLVHESIQLPDFESLPEWIGPICEVVLPMLAENDLFIYPHGAHTEIREVWVNNPFAISDIVNIDEICFCWSENFSSALVDAHIKITGEKGK